MKDYDLIDDDMYPPDWEIDGDNIIVREAEWRGNKMPDTSLSPEDEIAEKPTTKRKISI
jgi:hypothetical protein